MLGSHKNELETPALLINLDTMEENILKMSNFFKDKECKLRAHIKVHRLPVIAQKQIEAGAKGICCQKVSSAEVMAASGIKDILVSSQIVTPRKISKLVELNKYTKISVPVDSKENIRLISEIASNDGEEIDVFIDIHMGSNRCGVEPGEPALKLAKYIDTLKGVNLKGLMGFEGHISGLEPRTKRKSEILRLEGKLIETKKLIEKNDIYVEEISTGSTGTYDVSGTIPGITEVQAGTYVLMSPSYQKHVPEFDCAATILSTIISKPSENRIITDAGRMSNYIYGGQAQVAEIKGLEVQGVHAENTLIRIKEKVELGVGDKIEIYPVYLDGTMKLHDNVYGIRDQKIENIWKTIGRDTSK